LNINVILSQGKKTDSDLPNKNATKKPSNSVSKVKSTEAAGVGIFECSISLQLI
jgi:hypothetical protein